jgi:hypothetical protein
MKDHYDFSQSITNRYFKDLQESVTLQLKEDVLNYFTQLSEETGIPFQSLIILYLQDCVQQQRKLNGRVLNLWKRVIINKCKS